MPLVGVACIVACGVVLPQLSPPAAMPIQRWDISTLRAPPSSALPLMRRAQSHSPDHKSLSPACDALAGQQIKAGHVAKVAFYPEATAVEVLDTNGLQRQVAIFPSTVRAAIWRDSGSCLSGSCLSGGQVHELPTTHTQVSLLVEEMRAKDVYFFAAPPPKQTPPLLLAFVRSMVSTQRDLDASHQSQRAQRDRSPRQSHRCRNLFSRREALCPQVVCPRSH